MSKKKILFICGSLNQTTIMHQISQNLSDDYDCWFTHYYADDFVKMYAKLRLIDFTIVGNGNFRKQTLAYFNTHNLQVDYRGEKFNSEYELAFTCSDLIVPKNIRDKKILLIQEGMTDPETFAYYLVKYLHLPRWSASTSTTGMSNLYTYFCIASEGYRELFIRKGADPSKLIVTGIPNFDDVHKYFDNDFPHKNYLLVATSDMRETWKYENRKKLIKRAVQIAEGRQIIFKLHPNENIKRATEEINKYAPGSLIYTNGNTNYMIANCDILLTRYSSVVLVAAVLGKKVYSDLSEDVLKKLTPIQNSGTSAESIARLGRSLIEQPAKNEKEIHEEFELKQALSH
ncbi:MAG: hypothetical protein QY331_13130 [Melioribacteraceae bacterium]|nr:MAG: hypothetical protein QY331_13130 [Melioribacteraceae bacterium]